MSNIDILLSEDGCARKAKHLGVGEEFDDIFVGFAKLGTMAFVEDEDDTVIPQRCHYRFMALIFDGVIEFLDGGDNQSAVACHLIDELFGVVGGVYAVGAKVVEFFAGLVVEVGAIDHKHHFMDFGECSQDLGGFEAGEGFA